MNIYLMTRWGNGEDEEGPDSSQDTNMLVRAMDVQKASELADPVLNRMPLKTKTGREVEAFTHCAALLGTTADPKETQGIVLMPWYGRGNPGPCTHIWKRDSAGEGWITFEEYHGESPV